MLLMCHHVPCRTAKINVDGPRSVSRGGGGGLRGGGGQSCPAAAYDQPEPFRPFTSRHCHRLIPFIAYATDALELGKSFSLLSPHLLSWLNGFAGLVTLTQQTGCMTALKINARIACTAVWPSW